MLTNRSDLGFNENSPTYRFDFFGINTRLHPSPLEALAQSFISDRTSPEVVPLIFEEGTDREFVLYLRVRALREVHFAVPTECSKPRGPLRYDCIPELYFEAWIDQPRFDPSPTAPAVRCFIESSSADLTVTAFRDFDAGEMQFINKPPNFPF